MFSRAYLPFSDHETADKPFFAGFSLLKSELIAPTIRLCYNEDTKENSFEMILSKMQKGSLQGSWE